MQTYKYHTETKEYLYAEDAFLDPLETEQQGKEVYLLPSNSTFTAPIDQKEGYAVCWNGETWEYVEDHRQKRDGGGVIIEGSGTPHWLEGDTWRTPPHYMSVLGPLPDGAMLKKPEKSLEEVRSDAFLTVDSATSAAILAGFVYEVDGETLHFSYDSFDQQNFADTANAAMMAMQGMEGLPQSVVWNGWRNRTPEEKGELVRLALDVPTFLALYTSGAIAHKATQMEIGGQRKSAVEACKTAEEINALLEEWGIVQNTTNMEF